MSEKGIKQTNRDTCYFCGSDGPIQTHHLIPRRFDGSDAIRNLVDLCPTCHQRLERLYDDTFFAAIGAGPMDKQVQLILRAAVEDIEDTVAETSNVLNQLSNNIEKKYIRVENTDDAVENAIERIKQPPEGVITSTEQVSNIDALIEAVQLHDTEIPGGASVDQVRGELVPDQLTPDEFEEALRAAKQRGDLYEPEGGRVRAT